MNATALLRRPVPAALAALVVLIVLAGCGHSHGSAAAAATGSAASAARSVLAQPTVSQDLNATEQQLLANLQKDFDPLHPFKSAGQAVRDTYPAGSTAEIVRFAVKTFTLADAHPLHGPNPARDAWLQGVDTYARSLGAAPSSSPGVTAPGTASPAVTSPSAPAAASS